LCSFCARENESIEHLFWYCHTVGSVWDDILSMIHDKCPHASNLTFNNTLVIFGTSKNTITDRGLDLLILWTKFCMYKSKLQKITPTFRALVPFLKYRYSLDKYASIVNGKREMYNKIWLPYLRLIEEIQSHA